MREKNLAKWEELVKVSYQRTYLYYIHHGRLARNRMCCVFGRSLSCLDTSEELWDSGFQSLGCHSHNFLSLLWANGETVGRRLLNQPGNLNVLKARAQKLSGQYWYRMALRMSQVFRFGGYGSSRYDIF